MTEIGMVRKEAIKGLSTIRIVAISLYSVWLLWLYEFIEYHIGFPKKLAGISADKTGGNLIMSIGTELSALVTLWILIHLHKIIKSIWRGDFFHPLNPSRIKKVAIGLFIRSGVVFLADLALDVLFFKHIHVNQFLSVLWSIFIGTIVLMIAEVFSKGILLQQDQDLTV